MTVLVEADRLRKTFGQIVAVDDISLKVEKGEVLGFLGPNGAGKSTTMKMLTGFLEPDSGMARICGHDVSQIPKAAKTQIGYLPEGAPAYGEMTAGAFLRFIAEIRGFDGLAQAILHDPPVLIMDEPTDGLDPNQKHHVRSLIAEMARDKAIIVSTHILEEVEAVCTRAVVIDRGRIVADGTAEDLQRRMPYHNAVALKVAAARADAVTDALGSIAGVASVERMKEDGGLIQLRAMPKAGALIAPDVAALLAERGLSVSELYVERGRLDDVFRKITSEEAARRHA
jgi:ABC-2 type transport system ATP-binding protein